MTTTCTVRRATNADRQAIQSLQLRGPSAAETRDRTPVKDVEALIAAGHYFVAERQGRVVAGAGWEPHERIPDTAVVRSLFVHRAHGDQAGDALSTAELAARLEGYDHILIPSTPEALRFYARLS
jgi:hypothetical protein